jgi:hypothetical protein
MKRLSWKIGSAAFAAVLLVVCCVAAWWPYQDKKQPAEAAMQIPKPGPEMERLKFLIGSWDWNAEYEKTPMTPQGGKTNGWYKAQLGPGGFSIIADFSENGPLGEEIGHEVLAWDPKQNTYTSVIVGNFPGAVIGKSHWDGENLVTETEFTANGVTMHLRSMYTDIKDKSTRMEESSQVGDGPIQVIWKGVATRK